MGHNNMGMFLKALMSNLSWNLNLSNEMIHPEWARQRILNEKGEEIAEMGVHIPGWQYIILIKWINIKSKAIKMAAAGEISLKSAF